LQYEIIFFATSATDNSDSSTAARKKLPGWQWLVQTYGLLSRVLRKRLRRLWIVGAEKWVRVLVEGVLVVSSGKGRKKVVFLKGLGGLEGYGVRVGEVCVPAGVWEAESRRWKKGKKKLSTGDGTVADEGRKRAFGVREPLPMCGDSVRLPRVLREATSFLLMEECVKTEGVFRVNAKAVMVEALREMYETGQQFVVWKERNTVLCFPHWREGVGDVGVEELDEKVGFDVHAAAGLIKMWYGELRDPIFPQSCYQALEKFYGNRELELEPEQLAEMLRPDAEWTILSSTARRILRMHLLPLLSKVADFSDWNKMTASSLAVCFAPALLRGPDIEEDLKKMAVVRRLFEAMISNWKDHLAPAFETDYGTFEDELRLPEAVADREDPVEEGDDVTSPTREAQISGITLMDNDASASDSQHEEEEEEDDDNNEPPPLPPRPRTFSAVEEHRPTLPPRTRSSTVADIPSSSPTSSPTYGPDGQLKRKPAPMVQPLPRYSMVVGSSRQAPATLEHIPFYNTVEEPVEESQDLNTVPDLPRYHDALPDSRSRRTIPRKPVPKTSPKGGGHAGWLPNTYDNLMSSCYIYINGQQGHFAASSAVRDQSRLCTNVGDVRSSVAARDASFSSAFVTTTTTAGPLSILTIGEASEMISMASSTFDLGETEHDFTNRNLKLLTRSALHLTLPQSSVSYRDAQEIIAAGLWIMRGNGLKLSIRIEVGATAGPGVGLENFLDGLIDVLCAAKLWPQLSLKASCIDPKPSLLQTRHHSTITLALSRSDSLRSPGSKIERAFGPLANLHDVKPPVGVPVGFLDSVELVFRFLPLASPDRLLPIQNQNKREKFQTRNCTLYHLRSCADGRNVYPHMPSGEASVEDGQDKDKDILFPSPKSATQSFDIEMLDSEGENKDDLLFPDPEVLVIPRSPLTGTRSVFQQPPSSSSQNRPSKLDLLKFIDASLRHTIAGTPFATRSTKKSSLPDIKLAKPSSSPSLSEIAPALFRPGYMQTISHRASLIPRIASSLSAILSRSLSRTSQHPNRESPTPQANNHTDLLTPQTNNINNSPPQLFYPQTTARELQPNLWYLLRNRKWPIEPLEPLECDSSEVFERCERDGVMLLSSPHLSPSRGPAYLFSAPSSSPPPPPPPPPCLSSGYSGVGGRRTSVVKAENEDDEDMLDTHTHANTYHSSRGSEMLEQYEDEEEEEEDLFSSIEGTPFASQDMGCGREEEMLDDDEDEMEMGLLLEEEQIPALGMEEEEEDEEEACWVGPKGGFSYVEKAGSDELMKGMEGIEDDGGGGWGMLF
ncbi:MAG: hypothetical protein Q9216_004891, partial [Gyalolechia sp. 2 TL-2023]